MVVVDVVVKVHSITCHEGPGGEYRYNSTLSLTSAPDRGRWLKPRLGRFTPGKETRYPLYRRLGGPQGRCGRMRKMSPPPGFHRSSSSKCKSKLRKVSDFEHCEGSFFPLSSPCLSVLAVDLFSLPSSALKYSDSTFKYFKLSSCQFCNLLDLHA